MSEHKRTVIGNLNYSLETLKQMKKDLYEANSKDADIFWGICGIIVTLNRRLIEICHEQFLADATPEKADSKKTILEIKKRFNTFIDLSVHND